MFDLCFDIFFPSIRWLTKTGLDTIDHVHYYTLASISEDGSTNVDGMKRTTDNHLGSLLFEILVENTI